MRVETAEKFATHRLVLIGEAAHTIPPIGAQGFNLGLRDVATAAELVAQAKRENDDIGGDRVTLAYNSGRQADTKARMLTADLLNRSLLSDFLPVAGLARARPLHDRPYRAVAPCGDARGVEPAARSMPKLMRGEPVTTAQTSTGNAPVCTSHITNVSVATDAIVPKRTAAEACSTHDLYWRAIT